MRNGFTLIELLLVVVIIGILAALALPKFADIKARAHKAAMQSDLRNLATNEVLFDADSGVYAVDAVAGDNSGITRLGFTPSKDNAISISASGLGFTAKASRTDLGSAKTCSVTYGDASSSNAVSCTW